MIVLLFVAVSLIFVGVCFAVFLRVDTITVTGNTKYTEEEIVGLVPVEMGDNIFFFDADKTAEKIECTLPFVGEVTIKRDLPSTVAVEIIEEQPCFATGIAGDTYILSSDLKVLERRKRTSPEKTGLTVLQLNSVRRC
ncbi:MAG: FtsQ-type POTRA domain-containing protein, partial [Clostridia bacterium]|nr:FtsQ-type POTRA domain-containing protein [Clostridia bacterium]